MESPRSPKRRRILSSINPPIQDMEDDAPRRHRRERTMTPDNPAPRADGPLATDADTKPQHDDDTTAPAPKPTKFRFKSKSSRSSRSRRDDGDHDDHRKRRRRHRHRRSDGEDNENENADNKHARTSHRSRHHHRRRRHRSPTPPAPPPEDYQDPPLSPTTAFRESLFDALADDEGAAYWQAVYGQPIHIYDPPTATRTDDGATTLERMTDDEYAAYVRQKMWEKTHAGLLEARARREKEREERREKEADRARVDREMERCLRRGEERRRRRGWRERWEEYVGRWRKWEEGGVGVEGIPWPWEGDVDAETVRAFFVKGIGLEEVGEKDFAARLKEERVRWHPDKVQQRLGGKVEEKVMRDVTAIFQVVDALWNDTRKNGGQ
ncbi:NF-kappa-B inhibitor-like protein 1 [Staphylotrichum tortipilum]|uniref:NF-kappa-B inhibitor-like protein 1 n=1 Tax=Staphylotrichum tortipilum TaxID=2831512 RepID=A0AAN6MGQ0_9PEZI|nr:NF-kappa-B inhibitor-like protein 1 [Staphylotrichum longicolle]